MQLPDKALLPLLPLDNGRVRRVEYLAREERIVRTSPIGDVCAAVRQDLAPQAISFDAGRHLVPCTIGQLPPNWA